MSGARTQGEKRTSAPRLAKADVAKMDKLKKDQERGWLADTFSHFLFSTIWYKLYEPHYLISYNAGACSKVADNVGISAPSVLFAFDLLCVCF